LGASRISARSSLAAANPVGDVEFFLRNTPEALFLPIMKAHSDPFVGSRYHGGLLGMSRNTVKMIDKTT